MNEVGVNKKQLLLKFNNLINNILNKLFYALTVFINKFITNTLKYALDLKLLQSLTRDLSIVITDKSSKHP